MIKSQQRVDLIDFGVIEDNPRWSIGNVFHVEPTPQCISQFLKDNLASSDALALLFWNRNVGAPDPELISDLLNTSVDVWHSGLKLGLASQPDFIDFVSPTWMLNRDPELNMEATSWRLSLNACLIRASVLRQLGGPLPGFDTLEAAGLELGLRYIRNGVFIRHIPEMIPGNFHFSKPQIPIQDQLFFIKTGFGKKWLYWSMFRALMTGRIYPSKFIKLFKSTRTFPDVPKPYAYNRPLSSNEERRNEASVSVLIPTINRYPYLVTLLGQLRQQTVQPLEILVIDQTPEKFRDKRIKETFADLPLHWFELDKAGQCSSRNLGLHMAKGDYILFIDDDDEIPPNFIESHLNSLAAFDTNVSSGLVYEPGKIDPLDTNQTVGLSSVFPTNNTMIQKSILAKSGLFDLAYDRGQRADGDLGMRIYLSGEKMVLNPNINILHHHAPQGGLREHKARVNTHSSSRQKITLRVLPSVSDIYLARRYFTPKQVQESLWISTLGTFSLHGPMWKRILKVMVSIIFLPQSVMQIRKNFKIAGEMLKFYPQIPLMDDKIE